MSYPTSRKKYYLELEISSEWTDSELISDLHEFITSKSHQTVRDIFIENSERVGYFSVRNQETSEKLIKSFATNYISSGRKPSVSVQQISPNNYQIKLANINNIMTSKEFETWILSLNYHSFDIQLFPPQIINASNKCILSFDTINAAIHVKQTLENVKFRQFPLYFTHWHVPRRHKNKKLKSKPNNLSLNELQFQCSGYSTCCSNNNNSPIFNNNNAVNGPLYLRDNTIPAPPKRSPPAPPLLNNKEICNLTFVDNISQQSNPSSNNTPIPSDNIIGASNMNTNNISDDICDADNEKSDSDSDKYLKTKKSELFCIADKQTPRLSEEQSLPQMAFINSLHLEIKRLQLINEKLILQNRSVVSELDEEKKFSNYMHDKYNIIYNNYVNLSQMNKILLWNVNDIIQWICQLENGWFNKYKDILLYNLNQKEVNGAMLSHITQIDLCKYGIIDGNDQYLLLNHIKKLFQTV